MTCHIGRALDEIFFLQIIHQPIVEGMRGFCCERVFGKSVTGLCTSVLVIERVWRVSIAILYVMDWPASQSGEERAFGDAVGVEVGETFHGLIEDRVQLLILKMAVRPINAVLY